MVVYFPIVAFIVVDELLRGDLLEEDLVQVAQHGVGLGRG